MEQHPTMNRKRLQNQSSSRLEYPPKPDSGGIFLYNALDSRDKDIRTGS